MQILAEKIMANGLKLSIVDHSRPVAADRWYVKVVALLHLPVPPGDNAALLSGDPELDALARQRLGDCLEHQLVRERNFVDDTAKTELVEQLAAQLLEIASRYLNDENFPARLLSLKCREIHDLCRVERGRGQAAEVDADEPDDFSHCFR